ncbi:xylulokinase [Geochorda subterranea]|uniref:FGGY family carbohydrate kinase n=1 Tax=Geochorda subterranea TaxID=3109564 RepID=A0ABZ1BPJ2_9FIRM|nr:FGGY family carbohydrate kinase [Limnochorda sp. LNt]WRP14732.1 FGGY family carbohydrate kinase [Limnochorda sp. LNt]
MGDFLLGIDLGTSSVKVGLVTEDGRIVAFAARTYETSHPYPGWSEQQPEEWWAATASAAASVMEALPADGHVVGVGLSGQSPGHVVVAEDGTPLGPAIIWSDRRAGDEARLISSLVSPEEMRRYTGFGFPLDASNPLARLLWLVRHRASWIARAAAVLQPKDYIALRLTDRMATDQFSAFSVAHVIERRYHPDLFDRLGLPMGLLPPLLSPEETVGQVTSAASAETRIPEGTPVKIGTIDAWCSMFGAGALMPGVAVDIAGTSEVIALVTDRAPYPGDGGLMPLWPGLFFAGGPTQVGASALDWVWGALLTERRLFDPVVLERTAQGSEPGAGGLVFLPYLRGERAPIWNTHARGVLFNLTERHRAAPLVRAVYEGVAYSVRHVLEVASEATGQAVCEVRVTGGGSRSAFWNQVKADVLGVPVIQLESHEGATLGAAILAACPDGRPQMLSRLVQRMVRPARSYLPDIRHKARYDRLFETYKALYAAVKDLYEPI